MRKVHRILIFVFCIIIVFAFTNNSAYSKFIKGKVVDTIGVPINDVSVKIYMEDPNTGTFVDVGPVLGTGVTGSRYGLPAGEFYIPHPATGQTLPTNRKYIIQILPVSPSIVQNPAKGFISFYYKNALTIQNAEQITLPVAGYDCENIELTQKGASVQGKVSLFGSGDPSNIRILLLNENGMVDYNHMGVVKSTGEYFIGGLNSGTYIVKADTTGKNSPYNYISMYYTDNKVGTLRIQEASKVVVNAYEEGFGTPDNKSGIDFNLKKGAKIRGLIRDTTGTPITDTTLTVQLFLSHNGTFEPTELQCVLDSNYSLYPQEFQDQLPYSWRSSGSGQYEITGVPYDVEGNYKYYLSVLEMASSYPGALMIQENPQYLATYLFYSDDDGKQGTINFKNAAQITPKQSAEVATVCNFTLPHGGSISGSISLADPEDLPGAPIAINALLMDEDQYPPIIVSSLITGEGAYSLKGLPKGSYTIAANTQVYVGYKKHLQGFYNNAINRYTATEITLTDYGSAMDQVNFSLPLGGILQGRVVDADTGSGIKGIYANLYKADGYNPIKNIASLSISGGNYATFAVTDDSGDYTLKGIEPGSYYLVFSYVSSESEQDYYYTSAYYDGSPEGVTLINEAQSIVMKSKCNGIDCTMYNPVDFVECETGQTLTTVKLEKITGHTISGLIALESKGELKPTDVTLSLFNVDKNLPSPYIAIPVSYDLSQHATIDFNPAGLVKNASNTIFYSFHGVESGRYRLRVFYKSMPHYPSHSGYEDTGDFTMSKVITVSPEAHSPSVSFLLSDYSGSIKGSVLYNDQPVSGISIQLLKKTKIGYREGDEWEIIGSVISQADGSYTIPGLSEGIYTLSASDLRINSLYARQYYSSQGSPALDIKEAEAIHLTAQNLTVTDIDFNLTYGGTITGRIVDQNGTPYPASVVQIFNTQDKFSPITPVKENLPDAESAEFAISGLKRGNYSVRIVSISGNVIGYHTEPGSDPLDEDKAKDISISALNTSIPLGDIAIREGEYEIKGIVYQQGMTIDDLRWPLSSIEISAYKDNDNSLQFVSTVLTDVNGAFTFKGLHEGTYIIVALDIVTILDQTGNPSKYLGTGNFQSVNVTVPPSSQITLSIPLDKTEREPHDLSLKAGLNLIAYPTQVSVKPPLYNSLNLINDISLTAGFSNMNLTAFDNNKKLFLSSSLHTSISNIRGYSSRGSLFPLSNGSGYFLYTDKDMNIFFTYFPGQKKINLSEGSNIVGNILVDQHDGAPSSKDILNDLGSENIISIHNFDADYGRWESDYWLWNTSAGNNNEIIEDDKGYVIHMKNSVPDWSLSD
ncbi:MAG: hypothetical protein ACMUJM_06165 [bacterium]